MLLICFQIHRYAKISRNRGYLRAERVYECMCEGVCCVCDWLEQREWERKKRILELEEAGKSNGQKVWAIAENNNFTMFAVRVRRSFNINRNDFHQTEKQNRQTDRTTNNNKKLVYIKDHVCGINHKSKTEIDQRKILCFTLDCIGLYTG